MKKLLEKDPNFQNEMRNCLEQMDKIPSLRAKVFNQLGQAASVYNEEKGQEGIMAG